jgi:hypothetical protein
MGLRSSAGTSDSEPVKAQDPRPSTPTRRYNIRVPDVPPEDDHKRHRHAVYASEATGLLVIVLLLLAFTLVRYWHNIHWSLR